MISRKERESEDLFLRLIFQPTPAEPDELVELVCRMQKSRFDDQRCDMKAPNQSNDDRHCLFSSDTISYLDD